MSNKNNKYLLWGVELSPFTLKLQACLDHHSQPYRRLPDQGNYVENIRTLIRLEYLKQHKLITRYPKMDNDLDEYPLVPFLSQDGENFQYDSSSIAHFLDQNAKKARASTSALYPEAPALSFVANLINRAFDEFGLYLVHHMRWVGSAKSNRMGALLAKEYRHALPPGGKWFLSKSFPRRQVKRCPYLFSVAPRGYRSGTPRALTPPSRFGFPETHTLLFESWKQYLKGMEAVLSKQSFLLGERFTIADASAYGQLAMNLVDSEANQQMQTLAPQTHAWLERIYQRLHATTAAPVDLELQLAPELSYLLNTIMSTFGSLMLQNQSAYKIAKKRGIREFNELAFNQGKALYNGKLRGYPFKAVIKTFQVRVWQELCQAWHALPPPDKESLKEYISLTELFEADN